MIIRHPNHAINIDRKSFNCEGAFLAYSIIAASKEGPAINGVAIGTINGSFSYWDSDPCSSGNMSFRDIINRIMPPAIRKVDLSIDKKI